MPDQYTITGTVTPPEGIAPCWHQDSSLRSRPPECGTPATTDATSRSDYRPGRKLSNHLYAGAVPKRRRRDSAGIRGCWLERKRESRFWKEKNADISFRIFDEADRELSIISITALDREYGPDDIIFNAPTELEVSIAVDFPQESDDSEFERLMRLIAPVIDEIPLADLTDEDVLFLLRELGFEQEPEEVEAIEWIRRAQSLPARRICLPKPSTAGEERTCPMRWRHSSNCL